MANYGSVYAQTQKKLITTFIKWADGLEQQPDWSTRRVILCLSTNRPDDLDVAIHDRARVTVHFPLPSAEQCAQWWSEHTIHLTNDEHTKLGRFSQGLSFRALWKVAEQLRVLDVEGERSPDERPRDPTFGAVCAEIQRVKLKKMPTSEPAIDHFLKRLEGQTLGWAEYLAPDGLKQNLQAIPKRLDPAFRAALEQSGQKMWEQPLEQAPGIPMVLFHGPPGTGKTFAMRVLASQAKLDAWTLDIVGLQERSQTPEKLFVDILQRVENMRDAIIFIDECEALFRRRDILAQYASVYVETQKKMITNFIKWAQGLETQPDWESRCVFLCLATNMPDDLDPAILDRARIRVPFPLPDSEQCAQFSRSVEGRREASRPGCRRANAASGASWQA